MRKTERKTGSGKGYTFRKATGKATGGTSTDNPYEIFALVYDEMMDHVPYRSWASYLLRWARSHLRRMPDRVLDVGCGTGRILQELQRNVRYLYGMDGAVPMLDRAKRRAPRADLRPGRMQDSWPFFGMEEGAFPWIISTHDSQNYLEREGELERFFREAYRLLSPGGLLSIDITTLENILDNFAGQTSYRYAPGGRLEWRNQFDKDKEILYSYLKFFLNDGRQIEETHVQRYYSIETTIRLAENSGLENLAIEGDYHFRAPEKKDTMINLHFRKPSS